MSYQRVLKTIKIIVINIRKKSRLLTKGLAKAIGQKKTTLVSSFKTSNAGFVLPTVTMVLLVVVLLTVAILLRSFDRLETARNVKVSEQALSAATPALDRAKAKIQYLLQEDPTLPRQTPSDDVLYSTLTIEPDRYNFADEDRLSVNYDLDENNTIEPEGINAGQLEDDEEIKTAWRFPVDTDNNGVFDSYTIYSILFRTPPRDNSIFTRERKPLEARTAPMLPLGVLQNQDCVGALGSSASLVGDSGWYKGNGKLLKSFFVYTVTVPITNPGDDEEKFSGTTGIAALEYQEDWTRIPLTNNAVVYEDDLEISPGPDFRINGRILTNSNLVVSPFRNDLHIYQVSGKNSCFYEAENSKIIVGGNVVNGMSGNNKNRNRVDIDLFQGSGSAVITDQISTTNQSVEQNSFLTLYNNDAYERRIATLVNDQMDKAETEDPQEEVTSKVNKKMVDEGTTDATRRDEIRREEIENYFRDRTRKVPFAEVPAGSVESLDGKTPTGSDDSLRPPNDWMFPTDGSSEEGAQSGPTSLTLRLAQLEAQPPDDEDSNRPEKYLGDRILVGNNLPAKRWDSSIGEFVNTVQKVDGTETWTDSEVVRTREPRVTTLPSVGTTNRNGFWERAAAQVPEASLDGIGGLRVVTGAGIYQRTNSFLPPPVPPGNTYDDLATTGVTEQYTFVWPDSMPMSPGPIVYDNANAAGGGWQNIADFPPGSTRPTKGDLQMRATVLYHYAQDPIDSNDVPVDNGQQPIACISSYYDPTNSTTALNENGLPWNTDDDGGSNNGIVYPPPTTARPTSATFNDSTGLFSGTTPTELAEQANMVFPNGRFANEPLRRALTRLSDTGDLTLEEQAAIDSALCSLDILAGTLTPTTTPSPGVNINHGVIKEVTLLDARQIKAIDADDQSTSNDETFTLNSSLTSPANLTTNYDLAVEERQPLEIRLTQLDLGQMRNQAISFDASVTTGPSPEYLLPNSGIIYATRDDALPDRSDRSENQTNNAIDEESSILISPADYKLDPTRRPNGIMLINGQHLARNDGDDNGQNDDGVSTIDIDDIIKEKGLTLVSNLPVYIQGTFNPHIEEEFNQSLQQSNWSNFYTRTGINPNFACRPGDPRIAGCTTGDTWRPATVIADAITVLSQNNDNLGLGFRSGFRDEGDFDLRNNAGNLEIVGAFNPFLGNLDETTAGDLNSDGDSTDIGEGVLGFDVDGDGVITNANITVAGARRLNGFYGNNFVTNGLSSGAFNVTGTTVNQVTYDTTTGNPSLTPITDNDYVATNGTIINSSYFNNYVTPVQRRGSFPEYVMEICRKLPVSSCQPQDWVVGYDTEEDVRASDLIPATSPGTSPATSNLNLLGAGTTARPARVPSDRRYPRRVAFLRYPYDHPNTPNQLRLDANNVAIPLGINDSGEVDYYPYTDEDIQIDTSTRKFDPEDGTNTPFPAGVPSNANNALWFKTTSNYATPTKDGNYGNGSDKRLFYLTSLVSTASNLGTIQQPQLVPVLQYHVPKSTPSASSTKIPNDNNKQLINRGWLQKAAGDTTFNLVVGSGDVPPRTGGNTGETNGGLQNLPRFLENWSRNNGQNTEIIGTFIQLSRSAYATAPYIHTSPNPSNSQNGANSIFGYSGLYNINNGSGRIPFFLPPNRTWGFDVGLLSQSPDYFSQQLSAQNSNAEPDKYYREVSSDDPWIQTLLCSKISNGENDKNAVDGEIRPTDFCSSKTGG
ncbi:MAG: hormogonium polysaccharide biosynthesis protein HpsA [Trichodesmium sp. MAG_R04]|nr:hormogonium polysaccharide biosynthesis protein HpsA [Trichodesmium sp. MAG_R04]